MKRHATLDYVGSCRSHRYSTDWQTGATDFPNTLSFSVFVRSSFTFLSVSLLHQCIQVYKCRVHFTPASFYIPLLPF